MKPLTLSLAWTNDELQGFREMLGDVVAMNSYPQHSLAPVLNALEKAGVTPGTSPLSTLVHAFSALDGNTPNVNAFFHMASIPPEENSQDKGDFSLSLTLSLEEAKTLQFMMLGMVGPQTNPTLDPNDANHIKACKTLARAIETLYPEANSRITPIVLSYTDGSSETFGY